MDKRRKNKFSAIFLDRDGVITQEPPHYAHRIDQLRLVRGAGDAIRQLRGLGFLVFVISNQAGIAHGYYQESHMHGFNLAMTNRLKSKKAFIDRIYFCPHHPQAKLKQYRKECLCRKPKPGLIQRAAKDFKVDLGSSFFVGDKLSDIEAGKRAGLKTFLVKTGYGKNELKIQSEVKPDYVVQNLYHAAQYVASLA